MYRPPNASTSVFNDIIKQSENTIRDLDSPLPEIIIMGDFNFPGVYTAINSNNVNISGLVGLRDYLYLDLMITEPTRELNILDLLFCNQSIIESIKIQETVISDHNIIHVNTNLNIVANHSTQDINPPGSLFEQLNFFKADWNTITQDISESNLVINMQQLNTEDALGLFIQSIGDICVNNAPIKKCKSKCISSFFKHRKALMRKRRKLIIKSKKHGLTRRGKIKEQLDDIESELLKCHNDERLHDENKALDRIKSDPNYFFKYAKKFSKTATEVGPLLNANGVLVNDKRSMSEMLLKQFSSVFSTPSANHAIHDIQSLFHDNDQIHSNLNTKLTDIIFTRESVEAAIKSLKANSAPGPDGMTSELLLKCASVISEPLASLFSKSMHEASVPSLLKRAAVVPIYKGGDRSDPSNYRPVSLTPILMKFMEKMVAFLSENNLFNPNQHGFMKGRSCLSALLSVYDENILNLSNGQMSCTDMIYLDFAKAFDKVDHGVLLHKLKQLGITGKLGNWLLSFLSNRNHFVRILGGVSSDGSVLSGVPQGTVLGPLLFLVLLSDISSDINHSSVVSFADDTRVYREINEISDCSLLQNDLDNIYTWASVNNMVFNDSKFQHMSYHHQLQHRSCNHVYEHNKI